MTNITQKSKGSACYKIALCESLHFCQNIKTFKIHKITPTVLKQAVFNVFKVHIHREILLQFTK